VVENDGVGYFSFLHTLFHDHDLDFSDEYQAALDQHVGVYPTLIDVRTPTGLVANFFPVGPALLSAPGYLLALLLRPSGEPQYGIPFATAFALASLLFGLLALALSWILARRVAGEGPAAVAVVAVALATPFVYYLLYEPSYSHTFSAFAVGAFLLAWWRGRENRTAAGWLLLGLLGGLMALVRWQDGPLLAIALLDLPKARWRVLLLAPGALLALAPQLAVDRVLFGTWLPVRPAGQDLELWPGHYLQVLFASHHGLLVWSPVLIAAAAGYAFIRPNALRLAFAYALLVETIINGAAPDWWGGFAFGARRFLDLTPFFALGLAALAARVRPAWAWAAIAVLAAWNLVLMANFTYVIASDRDVGYLGLVAGQLPALGYLPRLFVQGEAVRALVAWPVLHRAFDPLWGLSLLLLQAACLAAAAWAAGFRPRRA